MPANGETVSILTTANIPVDVSLSLVKKRLANGVYILSRFDNV